MKVVSLLALGWGGAGEEWHHLEYTISILISLR